MNDNLKSLYNSLKREGYDIPAYDTFRSDMQDERKMRQLHSNLKREGYDIPDYNTFRSDMGFSAAATNTFAVQPASVDSSVKSGSRAGTTVKPVKRDTDITADDLMGAGKHAGFNTSFNDTDGRTITMGMLKGRELANNYMKSRSSVPGLNGGLHADTGSVSSVSDGNGSTNPFSSGTTPRFGTSYFGHKDLELTDSTAVAEGNRRRSIDRDMATSLDMTLPVTEWRRSMDDAASSNYGKPLTEWKYDNGAAARMNAGFESMSGVISAFDSDNSAERAWQLAEERTSAARNEHNKDIWGNSALNIFREMRMVNTGDMIHSNMVDNMTYHDLQKMSDDAWRLMDDGKKREIVNGLYAYLRSSRPNADGGELMAEARRMARAESDRRMFELAVEKNAPKSATEFFFRRAIGQHSLLNLFQAMARDEAGTTGDWEAREEAESRFNHGWKNKSAGIAGSVVGFVYDPLTVVSGGVGGFASKGAFKIGGKLIGQAAMRNFGARTSGKLLMGGIGSAANLGTFEAGGEMVNQLKWGGRLSYDPETGRYAVGDYDMGAVGNSFLRGASIGAVTGQVAPLLGNVSDKMVRATNSTAGKLAIRGGEMGVGTLAEGTIFSIPDLVHTASDYNAYIDSLSDESSPNYIADEDERRRVIENLRSERGDAMLDVWTDGMAMMAGFKLHHVVKSAPRRIAELSAVDNPRTMAERNHNRIGFAERLRRSLDGTAPDLALTRDERAELDRGGYGDLGVLMADYEKLNIAKERRDDVSQLPYNRFAELMGDASISEAARAKMYYYLTGRVLPMSTVLSGDIRENRDAGGHVTGFTVESYGANGVVTSRTFDSRRAAEMEMSRIERQAELNTIDVGEQYYDWQSDSKRMEQACKNAAKQIAGDDWRFGGATLWRQLYNLMKRDPKGMNEAELEQVQRVIDAYNELGDRFEYEQYEYEGNGNILGVKTDIAYSGSHVIREDISNEFGVDVENAIRKDAGSRSKAEQDALSKYANQLFKNADRGTVFDGSGPVRIGKDMYVENDGMSAFDRGYDADETMRRDISIEASDPNNTEAQEAWDGAVRRMHDEADLYAAQQREQGRKMQHKDGTFRRATLKEQDDEGHDVDVYVVDGRVEMMDDGVTVDRERSDETVVIYDPSTDKRRMISPWSDTGIKSMGEVKRAEDFEADIERGRQAYLQTLMDDATGTVRLRPGDQLVLPTGEDAMVVAIDADGEYITVQPADGMQSVVQRSELQRIADERAIADYRDRYGIAEEQPGAPAERPATEERRGEYVEGAPAEYTRGVELVVRDEDGSEKQVMVSARVRAVNNNGKLDYVPEENGPFVEYYVPGEKDPRRERPETLNEKVVGYVAPQQPESETTPTTTEHRAPQTDDERVIRDGIAGVGEGLRDAVNEQAAGVRENDINNWLQKPSVADVMRKYGEGAQSVEEIVQRALADNPNDETKAALGDIIRFDSSRQLVQGYISQPQPAQPAEASAQPTEQRTAEPMPVDKDGEEDWQATTPERAHAYIFNEAGLSRSEGNEFIAAQIQAAQSALRKASSANMPRVGTSIRKYNEAKAKRQEKIDEAQRVLDYWNGVREIQNAIQREENERRAAEDAARHEDAVAQAQEEYEARKMADAERKAVGNENPMPAITEKWNNATKVDGHRDEIMLPDGTALKGHYVLHESGASSPSHNPETWQKTDGFPMDANDNSVNDRDYERDLDAQEHTQSIARQYDQRALQNVPVVSSDGVVLSGNGRTMAGELAARDNSDGAYVDYLKEYAPKYGFTREQVEGMQHPRVSFVPDEAMPYTAETFSKFNQQEMKSQNKTEQAVKLGKTVSDDSFKGIVRTINGYDTLGDFYNDAEASLGAVYELRDAGVIPQAQLAEMVDGARGQEKLSAVGREFLENMLIGKAFEGDPDVVRMLTAEPAMRQSVINALGEIADNISLGDGWSLQQELSDAVRLCFDARKDGAKHGDIVSTFARQGVLFKDPDQLQTVADFNNATMLMLADVLNDKRVTLLKTTLQLYNNHARLSAEGQADLFAGGIRSREDILRDVINFINDNYGKRKEIDAARAAAVERRKAESVRQDGSAAAGSGGSENTGGSGRSKTSAERQGDLAQATVTAPLSEEVNEFDKPFVISSNGTTIFGEVGADSGLTAAPIKLSVGENVKDDNGTNHGYGLLHIEAGHGEQIRAAGFASVEEFVEAVARNYDTIREGGIIAGNQTYLLEISDEHNNTLFIQLSRDGSYWNVNSAGIFKKKYSRRKQEVFTRPALEPDTNTDTSGVDSGQSNGVTTPAGNSPQTSESKGKGNSSTSQAKGEKVAENQGGSDVQGALSADERMVNTEPTEAQNGEAGKDANEPTVLRLNGEEKSVGDIEDTVMGHVQRIIDEGGFDAEIVGVKVIGSYMRGEQTSESDLDVLVEYRGKAKEDALFDALAEEGLDINGVNVDINPITKGKSGTIEEFIKRNAGFSKVAAAEQEVNTEPTEAQKRAGNYKMGHVRIDGFDVTIENPRGSVRRGTDASGNQWEQEMHNTYGYIRGTEGVDGDHIDVFLSDDPSQGDVFVVDQVNKDGTFDEHKVMYGFPDIESARKAYLSNYEDGWTGLGAITPVSKEEFKKWIDSSHRKTKPFAEYSSVKSLGDTQLGEPQTAAYSIEPTTYTNKKGKTTPMHLVTFDRELSKDEIRAGKELAKESRGWWDREKGGFMMRDEDSAKALAEALSNEEAVQDAQPLSVADVATVTDQADMKSVEETIKVEQEPQTTPQYDYDREDDVYDKTLTGLRNVLDDRKRGAIPNIKSIENVISDLRKRAKTIEDGMATAAGETIPQAFDALANLNGKRRAYEQFLSDIRKKMAETERDDALAAHGVKLGDKIMYKGKEATIHDADARQVTLDTGLAPVLYEVTDWENVEVHKREPATQQQKRVNVDSLMGELNEKGEAKLSDHIEEPKQEESTEQPKQEEKNAKSKWVDDADAERFEELRQRLRKRLGGQLNMGIDPEAFAIGVEMSYLMLKHGARKFGEFAKQMLEALGENVRPYLKSFYNGARDLPEMAEYEKELTPYDEVRTFDVMNFDKEGAKDIIATAEHIVREQAAEREAKEATDKLKQERNEQRKEIEQQVAANTEALASEAATVASEVESKLPSARSEREVNDLAKNIDDAIDKVNDQLALLGYYEADPVESDFNEAYGYMRNAEKKAVKNVTELFKTLTKELGISDPVVYDAKGKKQKSVTANIAPAGGDVTMRFMLNRDKGVELYIDFMLEPDYENNRDNLVLKGIMYRPERNLPNGGRDYLRSNNYFPVDVTMPQMLQVIRSVCQEWLPKEDYVAMAQRIAAENEEKQPKVKKSKKKSVSLQEQSIPDLFSSFFSEELKQTSNEQEVHIQPRTSTTERERGHQREQNEPLGESKQNEDERPDTGRVAGRSGNNTKSDTAGGSRVSEPSDGKRNVKPANHEPAPLAESERKNTHNNHAERGTDYAPKGTSARIEANIKAIETMHRLIESGEPATPEDMSVLRKFSGWGGLGAAFKEKVSSGDSGYNPRLHDDYQPANPINARLRELLSPEAYEAANMSRNSAYYTPAPVIDAMWDVARAMGFRGGNVLEGSAGIGNIIGLMPTDMSERSNIHAVEIDETTGNILSLLYPDANVEVKGFEKTFVPNGSVDLAITNVPFVTGLRVMDDTGDKDLSRKFHDIHDFCIAKNVRKLKEGGVGIFITSSGTLDSPNSAKLRTWLVNEGGADVVGAFRMHNQTFGGTGATSDIIVIRKRVNGRKSANAIDVSGTLPIRTVKYNTGETKRGSSEVIVKDLALDVNKHFVEHPEDMAGEMAFAFEKGDTYRATSKALYPSESINQEQRLSEWAQHFKDMDWDKAEERESQQVVYEDLGEDVKEGSMLLDSDGNLCLAQRGKAVPINVNANKVKGHTKAECFNAYKAIKDALTDVLEYQTTHSDDGGLQQRLAKLNKAYDSFVKTYGHLNKNTSISFLRSDMDYPSIAALESVSETGDKSGKRIVTYGKTDIFSRRVVETESEPKPTTIKDSIIASIYLNGRVDVPYIAEQLNMSEGDVRQQIIESGLGFENPTTTDMEVSYEYLSGNVREKLRQAQENNTDGRYDANIKALERVIPMNIPAHLIEFTLGSSWVEPKLYEDFVKERTGLDVKLTNAGGTWIMSEPYYTTTEQNKAMGVISEKCDKTILGHELIKAAITCKSISVTKTISTGYGSSKTTETIVDKDATMACANKIDEIRQDFKDWARGKMQGDPEMSERMERVYNDLFNNSVPKEIPDEFVPEHFGGAATVVNGKPFKLRPHQAKAVIRATTQPLMLAHEVGTGKTYTLISTAMEMRRIGTARKPMIVVQNATVGQFVASAKALYPNAKILTLEDADRNAEGRRNFYAKIRYNDWDMIVVPQSVFERIPDSEERQIRFIEDKVEEKMIVLEKMREAANDDRDPVLRQAQRELDQLNDELNDLKLALQERKAGGKTEKDEKREAKTRQNAMVKAQEMLDRDTDDVDNFDDMGIDALLIDEAHEYKHLGFATAMQRGVKGVDPSYSKKSQGVYLKTQAVLESKNGKNVVFATGTPISNTAAEIWTFMRYLMPADTMREYGIYYFDDFVRNFGNIQQMLEFATNGKYKENNRFAGYVNLPELVRIWAGVADTVLTREAGGVSDKIPKMDGEKAQDIYLPQTKALRGVMKFVKDQLDDYENMSGKEKKENSHIPLVMYGIAKAAAVDARLVLEDAADEPNSKTNEAVRQTLRSLEDTKEYNGTVAIFADNYQNKATGFNLYEDIRKKLIDSGVPEAQVVVMKSGMSIKKKLEIFDKVNRGEVRVIMGSTFTLGTGVNIQERLHTLIHVDAPNRPMDYTQRNGRILRQGNLHNEWGIPVRVLRFGVEDSLDVTAYQRLKTKGAIADSIMEGKKMMSNSMENRVLEEEQDLFGDITAQLSGSQYALLKNQVEKEVKKLEARKKQWEADQTYVHNQKPRLKELIKDSEERAKRNKESLAKVEAAKNDGITIGKMKFPSLDAMGDYIKDYNSKQREQQEQVRTASGYKAEAKSDLTVSVGGFDFHIHRVISKEQKHEKGQLLLSFFSKTQMTYSCPKLGLEDVPVDGQRLKSALEDILENVLSGDDFREKAEYADRAAERYKGELQQVEARDGKPFEYADELKQAKEKLAEYDELMKAEMAEKEAKYAEMDASVEAAKGVQLSDEDSDDVTEDTAKYRIREDEPPTKTGIGYKVFVLKDGKLYPPMIANPGGEATPVGVWLDADAAPVVGVTKTGRQQVKAGGKGTQGGSGKLSYRPGWHLGEIPYALQFNRMNPETGQRELFPANFVWAEVEYANDVDYQDEAMSYGMTASGKFKHSLAGLPRLPENGSYRYRTNPDPNTDPWVITGAMKVNRILKPSEVDAMVEAAGREPQQRQAGAITDEQVEALNANVKRTMQEDRDMMRSAAEQMGEKLHTDINIIEDVNEITHPNAAVQERRRKSKGWYDTATGKVNIVLDNNRNIDDVKATVGHEVIAHKGLRELVGEENYDKFLDETYQHLRDDLKKGVDDAAGRAFIDDTTKNGERAKSYDQHRRTAVDELFGRMAEKPFEEFTEGERTLWQKLKSVVRRLLDKFLGTLKLPKWFELGDNELRYILWRSKERLERGREHPIDLALDIVKREELGLTDEARYNMGDAPETFKARQKRAVENKGTVMPGLNGTQVKVVDNIPRHPYTGNIAEATSQAIEAAKAKYAPNGEAKTLHYNNFGAAFDYSISGNAIETVLSAKHQGKSVNKGVHLALAEHLDRVIGESIEVEEHPDRIKTGDVRDNSKINPDALMHRFYGVARIDGKDYRVMTLMKEENRQGESNGIHSYEVQKIEVLDEETPNTPNGVGTPAIKREAYPLAKVIKDVGKTMETDKNLLDESNIAYESTDLYREGDPDDVWNDGSMGLQERMTEAATRLSNNHLEDKTLRNDALRAIGGNLADLRKAMSLQRTFDRTTVKRVADLARVLITNGYINNATSGEVKRLLSAVKNSVGHNDIEDDVQKVMDIMVDNQLKHAEETLQSLESIKGSKVDARGVEVQGKLDPDGQTLIKAMKEAQKIVNPCGGKTHDENGNPTAWGNALESVQMRMSSNDQAVAEAAAIEYAGMQMAQQWFDTIQKSKLEEHELSQELKSGYVDDSGNPIDNPQGKREWRACIEEAIRQNKIERVQAYYELVGRLTDSLLDSLANAKSFKEAEKERIREIQHNANSDMEGRPSNEHQMPANTRKKFNNWMGNSLFAPLATYMEMLRLFGRRSANGEGYLFNRFGRGWIDARQKEIRGVRNKYAILDKKAAELFGGKVKTWGDLIRQVGKLPNGTVSFLNGGEMKEMELTQGNLMYIYMVNKMLDGKIKLRKMGISEEDVEEIEEVIDPRLKELADWLQDEFLVQTRNEYNKTHKRMFGASMAAIEHYFPLRVLKNAIDVKAEDLDKPEVTDGISTITGSIIKRRRNSKPLDILNADALHVILSHVAEMEHWNAYAEFNRDLNTLRSYRRFRNQVQNMTTIYGNGKNLWNKFNDVCQMVTGAYKPKGDDIEKAILSAAQGVTAAKVSFRLFTALKQFASLPAYIPYVRADYLVKSMARPDVSWSWGMEHLPIFEERWKSRVSGDPRLVKSILTAADWRQNLAVKVARAGMAPNAFVDALTVSIGAYAVYQTRKGQYLRDGYSEEQAERRAIQDAEIVYNETQQSGESAFTSTMQTDRTWWKVLFSIFRNASMAYQRQLHGASRDLGNMMKKGGVSERLAFMKKQMMRDGLSEAQADAASKRRLRRQFVKDGLSVATFGYIMQLAWNIMGYLPYLLFGDDDETKDEFWDDIWTHTMGGWLEGLTGGDVMSLGIGMWLSGEVEEWKLKKEMPLTTDLYKTGSELFKCEYGAFVTDAVNLCVQMGLGANPQSITDGVLGIMDACGDDPALAHEATICISRILQVPQSQIDKMYFDEIGLRGDEVSKYTPAQLAERYAKFEVKRGRFFTPWSWDDEDQIDKYTEKANKAIKERTEQMGDKKVNEAYLRYEEVYNRVDAEVRSAKKDLKEKKIDYLEYAERMRSIQSDTKSWRVYSRFGPMDKRLDDLSERYLHAKSADEAAMYSRKMVEYKAGMVERLSDLR
ncbi:MAG: helicase-related protein [Prevotella sp.]|nr:helicase-related protein [Prevotella sp.]